MGNLRPILKAVFKLYREIGCYSSSIPMFIYSHGSSMTLASPIGDSFQLLEVRGD